MQTEDQVKILSRITTKDEAGRHFSQVYASSDLSELAEAGYIKISVSVHESGIPYSTEFSTIEITDDGIALIDQYPEYWTA